MTDINNIIIIIKYIKEFLNNKKFIKIIKINLFVTYLNINSYLFKSIFINNIILFFIYFIN